MRIIGIPKEIKEAEKRVALIPEDCQKLIEKGFTIYIQSTAGEGAGFADADYESIGCKIAQDAESLYQSATLIVKVKEPLEGDLKYLTKDHLLFCYLHLASGPELTQELLEKEIKAVAFETVVVNGKTPLLAPMSAIAGRLATQIGTWYLHAPRGGDGTLLGGIHGLPRGEVVVIGAGAAGTEAARLAYRMGAHVTILDINETRLKELKAEMPQLTTDVSNDETIMKYCEISDILVGSVYVVGRKAPIIVKEKHIQNMQAGSVVVDISIDQGGCVETSKPCTHLEPIYDLHGVTHSAITNLPAAAPKTASEILSMNIRDYVAKLSLDEWDDVLLNAVNTCDGKLLIEL